MHSRHYSPDYGFAQSQQRLHLPQFIDEAHTERLRSQIHEEYQSVLPELLISTLNRFPHSCHLYFAVMRLMIRS